jgi:hypothetical protein
MERMPRLTQPSRTQFDDPEDLESYDAVIRRRTSMEMTTDDDGSLDAPHLGEYWSGLINSPRLCALAAQMGTFVRTAGERPDTYSHADREFVDQVLSADWKTNVIQALHIPDGVAAGVRLEAVEALHYGREEELNEDEQLLARYIRQLVTGTVDDETFAAMKERLGARGVVEYSGFVLWLQWIIRMMQMIGVNDPPDAEIQAIIAGLKEGSIEVPDYRKRLG